MARFCLGLMALTLALCSCKKAAVLTNLETNCRNTAKWFNSSGKSIKVTVKASDHCAGQDSSVSLYKSQSDIAPKIEPVKDGQETSYDWDVPDGGYVKLTCNGEGDGKCTLTVTERD